MRNRATRLLFGFLILSMCSTAFAAVEDGSRPRNVAVSPDGQTILVTSNGSDAITIFINGTRSHLDVGAPSWGVCFLDNLRAVVTVPSEDEVIFLERGSATSAFTDTAISGSSGSFLGMTEVIPGTDSDTVFLANRGKAPSGADPWQHSVIELDVETESVERTLVSEREPRALALSPLGGLLFVGTAQGALGGSGLTSDNSDADTSFDGGSVVVYDLSSDSAVDRFAIGSPIRGMAIWHKGSPHKKYRLFLTNVGEGAQSENPDFGGRVIPNVVTNLLFNDDEYDGERQDVVIKHDPELEPAASETDSDDLPAVLPEKLVVRDSGSGYELWITNSASGTVSVLDLANNDGEIATSGTVNMVTYESGDVYKIVTGRNGSGVPTLADASTSNATVVFELADEPVNIRVDDLSASPTFEFSSNPRGIAYDEVNDEILVATQAGHQLVTIDGSSHSISRDDLATSPVSIGAAELRFFTFGGGFDFRESTADDLVNNISCGTCHVDGHIDGKVRLTVRAGQNNDGGSDLSHPVAVPSVFDVGSTEWIFFEGLITIADRNSAVGGAGGDDCNYCLSNEFFLNTIAFTNAATSPPSPWAGGSLSANAEIGRALFDGMNCNRCHAESAPGFLRTNDPGVNTGDSTGPIGNTSNLLSDPTQVFITNVAAIGLKAEPVGSSMRNMTNVGTRDTETDLHIKGVNTPALAGAWDNAPYFHDGRYRTLEEVLDHTWVNSDGLAASIWTASTAPENLMNSEDRDATLIDLPDVFENEFQFKTHSPSSPGAGWTRVSDYLDSGDEAALVEFLRSLSSQLDPYVSTTLAISNLDEEAGNMPGEVEISWNTNLSVVCRLTVENLDTSTELTAIITEPGTNHSETVTLNDVAEWQATVEVAYGSQRVSDDITWDTAPEVVVSNFTKTNVSLCSVQLAWNTNVSTACTIDWGVNGAGYPGNRETTDPGTSHSVTLEISPSTLYNSKIWVDYQPVASDETWKRKICIAKQDEPMLAHGEALSAVPNPFNPATEIRYAIPRQGRVELNIYDLHGRLVRSLLSADRSPGEHMEVWRGRDDSGSPVASGVYYLQLQGPDTAARQKLVLVE